MPKAGESFTFVCAAAPEPTYENMLWSRSVVGALVLLERFDAMKHVDDDPDTETDAHGYICKAMKA